MNCLILSSIASAQMIPKKPRLTIKQGCRSRSGRPGICRTSVLRALIITFYNNSYLLICTRRICLIFQWHRHSRLPSLHIAVRERLGYDINIEAGGIVKLIIIIKKGVETNYNEY